MNKPIHSRKLLSCIALAAALAGASSAYAADKVTIIVGGYEKQIYLPAKLAEGLGYFKAEGIDVELLNEGSGVDAENEMLAGAVQGVVGFYDHCVDLQTKGGKSLGVTGLGSSTNFLTQYMMVKAGVPLGEFSTIPVGAGTTFIAAMQQDKIQAGMTTEPTISRLLKTGDARVLVDMRTVEKTKAALGGTYPAAALYMSADWVEKNKPMVQKLANAFVKTLKFINTHSAAEIADKMPKDFYAGDKEGYIKALADGKSMFTADGVMPAGGPETVLMVLSGFSKNVKGKTVDLSKTYTTEFVKNVK